VKEHPHLAAGVSGGEWRPERALMIFNDPPRLGFGLWGDREGEPDQLSVVRVEMTQERLGEVAAAYDYLNLDWDADALI
jgi:hypothetical protein